MEQMNNIAYDSPLLSNQLHVVSESVYLNTTVVHEQEDYFVYYS